MSPWAWIVVAGASAVTAGAVAVAAVMARARHRAEEATADERGKLEETRLTVQHLETRTRTLRAELAEQHQANAELTARLRRVGAGDVRSVGLWALERNRQSRIAGTPLLAPVFGPGLDVAGELHAAIALELELLREEVGTYGELTELSLGDPLDAREALATLRVVQELTAWLAKRADDLRVKVARDHDGAVVTVEAAGWSDPVPAQPAFERGLAALDGTLELSEDEGTLVAVVRLAGASSP